MHPLRKAAIALVAAGTSSLLVWHQLESARRMRPRVWTAPLEVRDLAATVVAPGKLRWGRRVTVTATADRRIAAVLVRPGQAVLAGQPLVEYEPRPALVQRAEVAAVGAREESRVAEAVLAVARARLEAQSAASAAARHERLWAAGLVTEEAVEGARHAAASASLEVQARCAAVGTAEAERRAARAVVDVLPMRARAPSSGVVTEVLAQAGQWGRAGSPHVPPTVLMRLADPAVSRVEAQLNQWDAARVRVGQAAGVLVASLSTALLPAHVVSVQHGDDDLARVTLELDAALSGARDGLSAVAHLTTASRTAALAVPNHALVGVGGRWGASRGGRTPRRRPSDQGAVWTVRDGLLALAPLVLGVRGDAYSEVVSGLEVGQAIVMGPHAVLRLLAAGDAVVPVPMPGLSR